MVDTNPQVLLVVVDESEPWLEYVWEQFARINSMETKFVMINYGDYSCSGTQKENNMVLEYGIRKKLPNSLFVPKKKEFKVDDYVWLSDSLPVYNGTLETRDASGVCYDIFYNIFVHLSRLEEWESERRGKRIRSYSTNHPRGRGWSWKVPVVNCLFNELEKKLKKAFSTIRFSNGENPVLEFSHDVDYLHKTIQLRLKRVGMNVLDSARFAIQLDLKNVLPILFDGIKFAIGSSKYWFFDRWIELDKRFDMKSVFYVYARPKTKDKRSILQWLLDPSYDISIETELREKCKDLVSKGYSVGLHGSFKSAEDKDLLSMEKEVLESAIRCEVTKCRQHWLNYREDITPYSHDAIGIKEDSSLGFNDVSGFRSGIASAYNPYDHRSNRPFGFTELPMVVMDSHMHRDPEEAGPDGLRWFLEAVRLAKNFHVSVDWHHRGMCREYGWDRSFKELVELYFSGRNESVAIKRSDSVR